MCKKSQNTTQHRKHLLKTDTHFPALCATTAVTLTGVLAARPVKQKWNSARQKWNSILRNRQSALPKEQAAWQNGQDSREESKTWANDLEKIHAYLLSAISHDLRTPLSGIMGNSLLYLENHKTLSEEEKLQLMNHIHEDSCWLINMAENLLAITRIKDEGNIIARDEIVEEVLSEALEKLERHHPGCVVHVMMPEDIIMIPMDALLIEQVLLNLLENALIHSGSSEPIDILVENSASEVIFTIRDYGCGIPEKMLDNIFDGASRIKVPANHVKKTGIGLAVCKAVISAHHGTLTGRNHGHGAEFIFTLPKRSC